MFALYYEFLWFNLATIEELLKYERETEPEPRNGQMSKAPHKR